MVSCKGAKQASVWTVLCFSLPAHAPWVDFGSLLGFGMITSDMGIRGWGKKHGKKLANIVEVSV